MKGNIHSYESFGAADGPGVRFIVFLHGCNFRCVYCHNPDTWATKVDAASCRVSPGAVLANNVDAASCRVSPEDVLSKALRYRSYWGSDGGITVSGGEPMLQAEFVAELFERAHAEGVNTCLDTAAGPFRRDSEPIKRMLAATDTVLLDLKAMDPELHRKVTGADNANVFDCARYLAENNIATWIRHVNVPGLTDSEEEIRALEAFVATLPNVVKTEYLPYHTYGVEKWHKLGIPYSL